MNGNIKGHLKKNAKKQNAVSTIRQLFAGNGEQNYSLSCRNIQDLIKNSRCATGCSCKYYHSEVPKNLYPSTPIP